ncbi:methylmalonyl-CoA mutase family protein [Hellea sp.]|nr:methylmalonyl-CoA mutase family protein [Hellea sp.]MDA8888389.1 methylmalonyl-CoA mutase family protein [Hellea sp.]MDB4845284.1 methylmalonyl-CoA mutase family protein [Hellea sp.]MDC0421673.1 methylmalonyl-CoA mutase family protein [Hellea sp.]MDC0650680.1 methylmalonyl-CoA mutase family protein [Hellea sp.]MDC1062564.1 methylmalonyl-CoA mutase family protein [Hellea sp.]
MDITSKEINFSKKLKSEWDKLALKGLNGSTIEDITRKTDDNIIRGPLSTSNDIGSEIKILQKGTIPHLEGRSWHITAVVYGPDINYANKQALVDLQGGASALRLQLSAKALNIKSNNELSRLLNSIHTEYVPIVLTPNNSLNNINLFEKFQKSPIYLGLDPLTHNLESVLPNLPENWRGITINSAKVHNDGGTEVQELAHFASSVAYCFRTFGNNIFKHLNVELCTNQDAHLSIAKLRAARAIYSNITREFGVEDTSLTIHSTSSRRMMQKIDVWSNMLRLMSAGFGSVVGGADFITTFPYTDPIGLPTEMGHRVSRNMQIMMMEESHLGLVNDPAHGSFFHERMTHALTDKAWSEFQTIESEGGIENLSRFQQRVKRSSEERLLQNEPILGVTLHADETIPTPEIRGL